MNLHLENLWNRANNNHYFQQLRSGISSSAAQTLTESVAVWALFYFIAAPTALLPALAIAGSITAIAAIGTDSHLLHRVSRAINRTAIAALFGSWLFHPIIHESGHAFIANLLIKDPQIAITLNGNGGGATSYLSNGSLTVLGGLFGKDRIPTLIASGGFLGSLAWGLLAPAPFFIYSGMARLLTEALYAIGTYQVTGWNPAHDYQFLRMYANVQPLVPAAIMLGAFTYRMREAAAL